MDNDFGKNFVWFPSAVVGYDTRKVNSTPFNKCLHYFCREIIQWHTDVSRRHSTRFLRYFILMEELKIFFKSNIIRPLFHMICLYTTVRKTHRCVLIFRIGILAYINCISVIQAFNFYLYFLSGKWKPKLQLVPHLCWSKSQKNTNTDSRWGCGNCSVSCGTIR